MPNLLLQPSNCLFSGVQSLAPVVTASGGSTTFNEAGSAVAIDSGITVTDVDSANARGATVSLSGRSITTYDSLSATDANGITSSYDSSTGVLTASGTSSIANYQTWLRTVTYQNTKNPVDTTSLTASFTVTDSGSATSSAATKTIAMNAQFSSSPARYSGALLSFVPAWRYNYSSENSTTQAVTAVANSGDYIGLCPSAGPDCSAIGAASDANRPTWTTGNGFNATATFNGSSTILQVANSKRLLKPLTANATGEIWVWFNPQSSPTTGYILNSNRGSNGNTGFYLYYYGSGGNANKVEFGMSKGTAIVTAVVTTDTISPGTGKWIRVTFTPGTNTGSITIGNGTPKTFNVGAGGGNDATDDLAIGRLASNTTEYTKAHIGAIFIYNRQLNSTEQNGILAFNPTVASDMHYPWTDGDLMNTYTWQLNRFNDSYMYTDSGRTTLSNADGQAIKVAAHAWGGGSVDISRDMVSTGSTDPKRQSPSGTTSKALEFGGGGSYNTDRMTRTPALPRFLNSATLVTVKQTRSGGGMTGQASNIVNRSDGSSSYISVCSTEFDENPSNKGRHVVAHYGDGTSVIESITNGTTDGCTLDQNHFNVVAITRNGTANVAYVNGVQVATLTTSSTIAWDQVGGSGTITADVWLWGDEIELSFLPFQPTSAQVAAHYNKAVSLFGIT